MKKILAMLLAIAMLACLFAGCGNSDKSNDGSTPGSDAAPGTDVTAASDYEELQDKGTMVVGITDFAPMDYRDDNGEWTGFDAELARLVAQRLGVEVEFVVIDWGQKVNELNSQAIDVVWNGMTLTGGVQNAMTCTPAYCRNAQVVVVPAA